MADSGKAGKRGGMDARWKETAHAVMPASNKRDTFRHEAFSSLFTLCMKTQEDVQVPEVVFTAGEPEVRASVVQGVLGIPLPSHAFEGLLRHSWTVQAVNSPPSRSPDVRVLYTEFGVLSQPLTSDSAVAHAVLAAQSEEGNGRSVLVRCAYCNAPNLQAFIPQQMEPADAHEFDDSPWAAKVLPGVTLAPHMQPRHRFLAVVTTPSDTLASNVALDAALKCDPDLGRTLIIVAIETSQLNGISSSTPKLFSTSLQPIIQRASRARIAVVLLPGATMPCKTPQWRDAVATADSALANAFAQQLSHVDMNIAAVGFAATARLLEREQVMRQTAAAQGLLSSLQLRCAQAGATTQEAQAAVDATVDAAMLRKAYMQTVTELLDALEALMLGNGIIDMEEHGWDSMAECEQLREEWWPLMEDAEYDDGSLIPVGAGTNADVPLYGMAACQRCLEEFDVLLENASFASPIWQASRRLFDRNRVANMLLATANSGTSPWSVSGGLPTGMASALHATNSYRGGLPCAMDCPLRVGQSLGRNAAALLLQPLVAALCSRLLVVLQRVPRLAVLELQARHASSAVATVPESLCKRFAEVVEGHTREVIQEVQEHLQQQMRVLISQTFLDGCYPNPEWASPIQRADTIGSATTAYTAAPYARTPVGHPPAVAVGEGFSDSDDGDFGDFGGLAALVSRQPSTTSAAAAAAVAASGPPSSEGGEGADTDWTGVHARPSPLKDGEAARGADDGPAGDRAYATDGDALPAATGVHDAQLARPSASPTGEDSAASTAAAGDRAAAPQAEGGPDATQQPAAPPARLVALRSADASLGSELTAVDPAGGTFDQGEPGEGAVAAAEEASSARYSPADMESHAGDSTLYLSVLQHAEDIFDSIRGGMQAYNISHYIRAKLLQPFAGILIKRKAMLGLFAGSDDDVMSSYGSQTTVEAMRRQLEAARTYEGELARCKTAFEEVATNDAQLQQQHLTLPHTGGLAF